MVILTPQQKDILLAIDSKLKLLTSVSEFHFHEMQKATESIGALSIQFQNIVQEIENGER